MAIEVAHAYLVSERCGVHSCLIVAACLDPLTFFLLLITETMKPAPRIWPNHELEVGVDAIEDEELFGVPSAVRETPHVQENARKREGIARGVRRGTCRGRVQEECGTNEWGRV